RRNHARPEAADASPGDVEDSTEMSPSNEATPRNARGARLGGWLAIPDPLVVEVAARAGFDWIGFDLQHGAWDLGTAFRGIQLADVLGQRVLVRLPDEQLPL